MRFPPGTRLGPYELQQHLGSGGMGVVYRARDVASARDVALKLIKRPENPTARERFRREGELMANLRHPGIVRVHSAGEVEGFHYLACELVPDARPFDTACAGLPLAERLALLVEAAQALGFAHAQGIVHRDVKAENLLVDGEGRVRLTDFGLATAQELERLTRTGVMVGTPAAMAPEQFSGKSEWSPATDVWALGVLLYEQLTGQLPFEASSLPQLIGQVTGSRPPRPRSLNPSISPALEAVCMKALERDPARRQPSGEAPAAELQAALDPGRRGGQPGRRHGLVLLAGLALLALLGVGLASSAGAGADAPGPTGSPTQAQRDPQPTQPTRPTRSTQAAPKPDRQRVPELSVLHPRCRHALFLDDDRLLTAGQDGVRCWDLRADPPRSEWTIASPRRTSVRMALVSERDLLLIVTDADRIRFFSIAKRTPLREPVQLAKKSVSVFRFALPPAGTPRTHALVSSYRVLRWIDLRSLELLEHTPRLRAPITSLAMGPDLTAYAAALIRGGGEPSSLLVRRPVDPDGRHDSRRLLAPINSMTYVSGDRPGLWAIDAVGAARQYTESLEPVQDLSGQPPGAFAVRAHEGPAQALAALADGRLVTIAHSDQPASPLSELRLWGANGALLATRSLSHLDLRDLREDTLCASPSGQRLAVVCDDRAVVLSPPRR